jgi:hypothetical protein
MVKPSFIGFLAMTALLPGIAEAQERGRPQRWTVEPAPAVLIGAAFGESEYLFTNLRGATVLSDRRIVALDASRDFAVLRYYGPQGQFLKSAGRWGKGPFEFEYPVGLHKLGGDSLYVLSSDQRFSIFGPQGEGVSAGRLELGPLGPTPTHLVSRSHLALQAWLPSGMPDSGTRQAPVHYVSWDLAAKKETPIVQVQGMKIHYEREGPRVRIYPVPFSPMAFAAASGGLFWVAQSDEPRVRGYDPAGRLGAEIRLGFAPVRVGSDDRDRFRSGLVERASRPGDVQPQLRPDFAQYARSVNFPDAFPLMGNLKGDPLGNVWVQEYETPWATGDQVWHVFDRTGREIAVVALPEAVASRCGDLSQHPAGCDLIFEIGADYLLIHRRDDLGVSQIALHRLRKTPQ